MNKEKIKKQLRDLVLKMIEEKIKQDISYNSALEKLWHEYKKKDLEISPSTKYFKDEKLTKLVELIRCDWQSAQMYNNNDFDYMDYEVLNHYTFIRIPVIVYFRNLTGYRYINNRRTYEITINYKEFIRNEKLKLILGE